MLVYSGIFWYTQVHFGILWYTQVHTLKETVLRLTGSITRRKKGRISRSTICNQILQNNAIYMHLIHSLFIFSEKVLILENRNKNLWKKGTLSFNLEVMKDDTKINVKWYLRIELGDVWKYLSVKKSHFLTFFHIPCYFNQMKIWI